MKYSPPTLGARINTVVPKAPILCFIFLSALLKIRIREFKLVHQFVNRGRRSLCGNELRFSVLCMLISLLQVILFVAVMGATLPGEVILLTVLAPHNLHDFILLSDRAEQAAFYLLRPRQSLS